MPKKEKITSYDDFRAFLKPCYRGQGSTQFINPLCAAVDRFRTKLSEASDGSMRISIMAAFKQELAGFLNFPKADEVDFTFEAMFDVIQQSDKIRMQIFDLFEDDSEDDDGEQWRKGTPPDEGEDGDR